MTVYGMGKKRDRKVYQVTDKDMVQDTCACDILHPVSSFLDGFAPVTSSHMSAPGCPSLSSFCLISFVVRVNGKSTNILLF